jgi:hypothetical protein
MPDIVRQSLISAEITETLIDSKTDKTIARLTVSHLISEFYSHLISLELHPVLREFHVIFILIKMSGSCSLKLSRSSFVSHKLVLVAIVFESSSGPPELIDDHPEDGHLRLWCYF